MSFKKKLVGLYENPQKIKENRWVLLLLFLVITISKDYIKRSIGVNIYNLIIACITSFMGICLIYGFIEYIKKNEKYDMKKDKLAIIISSLMILCTVSYLGFLLIV